MIVSSKPPSPDTKNTPAAPSWVKPRDAAGLILIRGRGGDQEVFLGRRHPKLRFAPGVLVGPGGALSPEDLVPWPKTQGKVAETNGLDARSRYLLQAFARAALREAWEEAGLIFGGAKGEVKYSSNGASICNDKFYLARNVDFSRLRLIARAITPRQSKIRFHSRFFLADGALFSQVGHGDGELEELGWRRIADLQENEINDVALLVIQEALMHLRDPARRAALFTWRGADQWEHYRRDP